MELTLYYRNDLTLSDNERCACFSQALIGFWLSFFRYHDEKLSLDGDNIEAFLTWQDSMPSTWFDMVEVNSLDALRHAALLPDRFDHTVHTPDGHQPFCLLSGLPRSGQLTQHYHYRQATTDARCHSAQIMLINQDIDTPPENKWRLAAITSFLSFLERATVNEDGITIPLDMGPFSHWVLSHTRRLTGHVDTHTLTQFQQQAHTATELKYYYSMQYADDTPESLFILLSPPVWQQEHEQLTANIKHALTLA